MKEDQRLAKDTTVEATDKKIGTRQTPKKAETNQTTGNASAYLILGKAPRL